MAKSKGKQASAGSTMWQKRLLLDHGHRLELVSRAVNGNLGQREVEVYRILDATGNVVGSVTYAEDTSLKPPHHTNYRLTQVDSNGSKVVDADW